MSVSRRLTRSQAKLQGINVSTGKSSSSVDISNTEDSENELPIGLSVKKSLPKTLDSKALLVRKPTEVTMSDPFPGTLEFRLLRVSLLNTDKVALRKSGIPGWLRGRYFEISLS